MIQNRTFVAFCAYIDGFFDACLVFVFVFFVLFLVVVCFACLFAANLPEDRIRALNDEINKLIRERGAWERHIKSLGGADHGRAAQAAMNEAGILGSGGYR